MGKQFFYTAEHLAFLKKCYMQKGVIAVTADFNKKFGLNKSVDTIKATLTNNKIRCGRNTGDLMKGKPKVFTLQQKQWFIDNYPKFSRKDLVGEFNRVFAENRKASQIIAFLKNNKIRSGRTAHFKPGHKSWNKGSAGTGLCKPNSGSFKKGGVPHNWVPVGTERVVEGGYIEVKTAEPHEWTQKHRILYEKEFGEIPENHKVRFKDGDPSNITISNLFLVNNSEHQLLNNMGFKRFPDETKDTLVLIARVQSKSVKVKNQIKDNLSNA